MYNCLFDDARSFYGKSHRIEMHLYIGICFGGLECVGHSFAYVAHYCIFERCLNSNPECCRSKQARYLLSQASPYKCIFFLRVLIKQYPSKAGGGFLTDEPLFFDL